MSLKLTLNKKPIEFRKDRWECDETELEVFLNELTEEFDEEPTGPLMDYEQDLFDFLKLSLPGLKLMSRNPRSKPKEGRIY